MTRMPGCSCVCGSLRSDDHSRSRCSDGWRTRHLVSFATTPQVTLVVSAWIGLSWFLLGLQVTEPEAVEPGRQLTGC